VSAKERTKLAGRGIKRVDLAYVELASSENARDINRDIILELIRSRQPISRADLSRASGLQPSTVSAIAEQLLHEKWITEGALAHRPRGRRPTLLALNDQLVILVADIRPRQAIVALVDLNERFLTRAVVPLVTDPERAIDRIVECMKGMRAAHPDRSFEGIGLSMPGRVDPTTQRLILAPNLKWGDFDIKKSMEQKMKLQVELANAANACLLSETWSGRLDRVRDAVLVTVSEGIGSAILANGQIITSRSGLAGEFGHSPIDPNGPVCGCGQRGCWEVFASSNAALRYYAEAVPKAKTLTYHELLHMTEEGDKSAIAAVTRQCTALGRGLRLITAALAPEVILITGDLTASWARFGPIVQHNMEQTMLTGTAPRLAITSDGELSRLRGAAAVVLQRHSGHGNSSQGTHRTRTPRPNTRKPRSIV
jgi:predicted NBD/HSP70 family sugar kinase